MLKVRTLFSGIGSPEVALRDLQIPYELIDFCEVDKYAVQSYCAVHGVNPSKNLGDITKVWGRNLLYADLMVWGFPCTDISVAGKQAGIVEGGTRSGLYYEGLRILRETKPKYSIIENVKNLTGKKFKAEFEQMLKDIEELGYNNYWKVLNAKDYGIPQNRERVFIVSIRKDVDKGYEFPQGFDNGLRLKDLLETEVDEKYYISQDKTEKLISQLKDKDKLIADQNELNVIGNLGNTGHHGLDVYSENGVSPTLKARDFKDPVRVAVKEATKQGYAVATVGDSINLEQPNSLTRRGRVGHEVANTLTTSCNQGIVIPYITPDRVEKRQNGRRFKEDGDPSFTLTSQDRHGVLEVTPVRLGNIYGDQFGTGYAGNVWDKESLCPTLMTMQGGGRQPHILNDYRIRKLTPKECWRLMGFKDEDFQKAKDAGVSDIQLYKQAGNSIYTGCLLGIYKNLLQSEITQIYEENKELS